MALLNKLKSLLGLDDGRSGSDRQGTDVGVTVEHEPGTAETGADEEAPPATPAPGAGAADPEPAEDSAPEPESESEPEREMDADAGSATDPDIDPEFDAPPVEGSDEPSEEGDEPIAGAKTEPLRTEDPEPETAPESTTDGEAAESGSEPDDGGSVREIKGIGPSYATKLSEAGVDSASELAAADAGELSEATGLSEKRIQGWIERAQGR